MTLEHLAMILRAGERRTWGIHDATTTHLGSVLRAMAAECDRLDKEGSAS
jgi:hypothetical protein